MGEGLGEEPRCKTAKLIGQHAEGVWVGKMLAQVAIEGDTFYPVHHQHRVFIPAVACVYYEFALQKTDVCEIGRGDLLQFFGNEVVGLGTPGLVFEEALHRMKGAVTAVLHLEDHSEIAAAHNRIAIDPSDYPIGGQLVEVVLGQTKGIDILFYSGIEHSQVQLSVEQKCLKTEQKQPSPFSSSKR